MADRSPIEWTDASWNPLRARNTATGKVGWFCTHVSEGCRNCYAEGFNRRLGTGVDYKPQALKAGQVELFLDPVMLNQPLRWKKPRMIFVGSMTDVFADFVTDDQLDQIFAVALLSPRHTFQFLTKRPERMRAYLTDSADQAPFERRRQLIFRHAFEIGGEVRFQQALVDRGNDRARWWPLPNVWLGVSVEDQARADERIPILLDTPAAVRWISAEPLLGPVRLTGLPGGPSDDENVRIDALNGNWRTSPRDEEGTRMARLDWVVAGGESGPGARPMHPDWARQLRDQCAAAGVPFLFKQWGEFGPAIIEGNVIAASHNIAWPDGSLGGGRAEERGGPGTGMLPLGKKAAGRLLDGVLHDGFPEARP